MCICLYNNSNTICKSQISVVFGETSILSRQYMKCAFTTYYAVSASMIHLLMSHVRS